MHAGLPAMDLSQAGAQPAVPGQTAPATLAQPNIATPLHLSVALATGAAVPLGGVAVQIVANAQIGRSRFEIRLDPPELGRIDVRLDIDRHGQVTSHLTVEKPATLDLLRRDAPQLERALQDAGLKTGDSGLQFSLRDQSTPQRQDDGGSHRHAQRLVIAEEDAVPAEIAGRSYGRKLGASGGVDIRV
jgi:chemotaxis protein MotD